MLGSRWSLVIALGIPALACFVGVPLTAESSVRILGMPLVFAWMFAWMPLTTLCLWVSWRRFDEARYRDVEGSGE
jgi:hypothetical protein